MLPAANDPTEAEPISPDTARRFPHLAPYVGNVLLGSHQLHIVLAGVPAVASEDPWQAAIQAVFVNREGHWTAHAALAGLDLQNVEPTRGTALHQLAVDLGHDPDGSVAYVSFIYGANTNPGPRELVTWRLDGGLGRLSVYFDKYTSPPGKTVALAPYWHLRLRGDADVIRGNPANLGSLHGLPYVLRYKGGDALGIVGYRPFTDAVQSDVPAGSGRLPAVASIGTTQVLSPALAAKRGGQLPPIDGFEFLLTPAATNALLGRVANLADCLYGVERPREDIRDEAKVEWSQTCEAVVALASLQLQMAPADAAPSVPQPIFVFDGGGRLIQAVQLTAAAPVTLSLTPGTDYQLGDTAAGRALPGTTAFSLVAGESKTIVLPPRQAGELFVATAAPAAEASLIAVENLGAPEQLPGFVPAPASASDDPERPAVSRAVALSPHVWLTTGANLQGALLVGNYTVTVARGRSGSYCRQSIAIVAGRTTLVDCNRGMAKLPQPLAKDVSFADLALPTQLAGFSAESVGAEQDAVRQALGVDVTAREAQVKAQPPQLPDGQHLPVLTAVNAATAVSLRFWPATPELARRWEQALHGAPADPVARFARFLQDENAQGWSELGCPIPGMSDADYAQLIQQLHPTALRLFGCAATARNDELMALWARLAVEHSPPLLLTAASWLDVPEEGLFLPRVAFEVPHATLVEPGSTWRSLQTRAYSLSAGATAFLRQLQVVPPAELARRRTLARTSPETTDPEREAAAGPIAGIGYDLSVSVTLLADAHARELAIYTEKGRVKRAYLPRDFGPKGLVTIQSLRPGDAHWLRIEVRGPSPRLVDSAAGGVGTRSRADALLAATNFISIEALSGGAQMQTQNQGPVTPSVSPESAALSPTVLPAGAAGG